MSKTLYGSFDLLADMKRFLFLHGGGHGAWCWDLVRYELEVSSCESYALDFPGHGSDPTPRREVTAESYVQAATKFIVQRNLTDLTVVGHSLAGAVLPAVWHHSPARIRNVVFLAALVLRKGEAPIDLIPEERRPKYFELAEASGDNTIYFDEQRATALFFNDLSPPEASAFYRKLTPQPFAVYLHRAASNPSFGSARIRYVLCSRDQALPENLCRGCARKIEVEPEIIDAGHDAMLSRPKELVELLLG